MSQPFILPEKVKLKSPWAVTATPLQDSRGAHHLDLIVVSFRRGPYYELRSFLVLPRSSVCEGTRRSPRDIVEDNGNWADEFIKVSGSSQIEPASVLSLLHKKTARNVLSGHLVGVRYLNYLKLSTDGAPIDLSSRWERELKAKLSPDEESLIKFTASSYEALLLWLESSPAQVLASLEGVSPSTIRNRIYAAREAKLLSKPGSGRRSVTKK